MKIGNLEVYGVIYKVVNKVNGKVYIGKTTNGFKKRYSFSGEGIERVYRYNIANKYKQKGYNKHLVKSIEKYGFINFYVNEVLDVAFSEIEINIKEQIYIKMYDSYNNGYNATIGGEIFDNYTPVVCLNNRETFYSMSKACDKYNIHRSSMVNCCKGKIDRVLDRVGMGLKLKFVYYEDYIKMSEEKISELLYKATDEYLSKKISDAHIGVQADANHPLARRVRCVTTGEVFETIKSAINKYGCKGLYSHLTGKSKYSGKDKYGNKLIWEYCYL